MLAAIALLVMTGVCLAQNPAHIKFRFSLADPNDHVLMTLFSPDGSKLLLVCQKSAQIWSTDSGKLLLTFAQKLNLTDGGQLEWQPGGSGLLQSRALGGAKHAYLWDTHDGRLLATLDEKKGIHYASWNRDGTRILTVGEPYETHRLRIRQSEYSVLNADGRVIRSAYFEGTDRLMMRFDNNGRDLIINVDERPGGKPIQIVDADTGRLITWFDQDVGGSTFDYARFVSESPDSRFICGEIEDSKGTACWDTSSRREPLFYLLDNKETGNINFLSFSPRSNRFAVSRKKQKVIDIVDPANGKTITTLNNPAQARVQFYPLWNGETYDTIGDSWSPDGKYFLASDIKKNAYIWDTRSGRLIATIPVTYYESNDWFVGTLPFGYQEFYFQPSGKILMSVNRELVRLWDPASGRLLQQISDTSFNKKDGWSQNQAAKWQPDGRGLTTTTDKNRTLIYWEIN